MDKQKALDIIKLLSAIESASLVAGTRFPDYMYESISACIEELTKEVLK